MPVSQAEAPLPPLPRPWAVVAHDAGGAEILSSLLRAPDAPPLAEVRLVLDGPARAVFQRKLGVQATLTLDQALDGAGAVLTGTGWQSTLEFDALGMARVRGIGSVAFLDHWVNYRERFLRAGVQCLPDALWVGDADALALARAVLPDVPATLVPNPYFAEMRTELAAAAALQPPHPGGQRVLFVCEPVREPARRMHGNERHWGYTEEEALAYALQALPRLSLPGAPVTELVVRPHPSEAPDKYDAQLAASPVPVRRGGGGGGVPLLDEVAACDTVIGCNSVAMVIGLLGGKRVLCAIPPGGADCLLPQREIGMLRDLA